MKLTIIGDVHENIHEYEKIITNCESSICVGDFGFKHCWDWHMSHEEFAGRHIIIPGNHDDYSHPHILYNGLGSHSIGNYKFWEGYSIFTVRGAESIDKHLRNEGIDWFVNEELNYQEQLEAFDQYVKLKPRIVISHDCPQSVMEKLFGYSEKSQTRTMLEMMFQEHQPDLWVFGHHHKSKDVQIGKTRFICLAELEIFEIEL